MSKSFSRGGALQLLQNRYGLCLTWNRSKSTVDLDLQALIVDDTGVIVDAVYYNRLEALDRAVAHSGDGQLNDRKAREEETIWVNLAKVRKGIKLVIFIVAAHGGSLSQAVDAKLDLVEQWQGQTRESIPVDGGGGIQTMTVMNRGEDGPWTLVRLMNKDILDGTHFMDILDPTIGDIIRKRIRGAPKRQRVAFPMSKGSHAELPNTRKVRHISVGVGWDMGGSGIDLDVSAVVFGDVGQKIGAVYYNNTKAYGLCHTGDNETGEGDGDDEVIMVDLEQVPDVIVQIFFVVNIYTKEKTFSMLKGAYCRVTNEAGDELLRYALSSSSPATSGSGLIISRLLRNNVTKRWGFQAVGAFCEGRKWMDRTCLKEMQKIYYMSAQTLQGSPNVNGASLTPRRSKKKPEQSGTALRQLYATQEGCVRASTYCFRRHTSCMQRIRVGVGWDILQSKSAPKPAVDLDVAAVFFHEEGRDVGAIDYENMEEFGVKHSGDNTTGEGDGDDEVIDVNLDEIPSEVSQLFFVVTVFTKGMTFSKVENAYCRVLNEDGEELVRNDLSETADATECTALVIAQIFRVPEMGWFFKKRGSFLAARTWLDPCCMFEMKRLFADTNKEFNPDPDAPQPQVSPRARMWRGTSCLNMLGRESPDVPPATAAAAAVVGHSRIVSL